MIVSLFKYIKKFYLLKILKKKYTRTGSCNACGRCCREIYVKHAGGIIQDEEEFERLKKAHWFYTYLSIINKTENGLVFECKKLDKEANKCTVYKNRALLCRMYPQEEIFMMGGEMSENCGYSFTPIESFQEVLKKVTGKAR